jgi:glycosyltransferase involved in cell wall biosynthesis
MTHRPAALYMTLSGGFGIFQDLPFAAFGILVGVSVYVHHHSFAYLDKPSWYSKVAFWALRRSTHIVLCNRMKQLLLLRYGIAESHIAILSNAAFIEAPATIAKSRPSTEYVIGFLSNITEPKGIFKVLNLAKRVQESGVKASFLIGGPLAKDIELRFSQAVDELHNVQYLGPLYGKDKTAFFERLNLFVFPSADKNEAEPIVVLEAMRVGVPTLGIGRGCIAEMLKGQAGEIAPPGAAFEEFAFNAVMARIGSTNQSMAEASAKCEECFSSNREIAVNALSRILTEISRVSDF